MERLVIVTGLSGSGKSLAVQCLEDLDFFCVDNLPVGLIPPFCELIQRGSQQVSRAALVIDIREKAFLEHFPAILRELRDKRTPVQLLFLECNEDTLKRRFSETRRPHPMAAATGTLEEAIRAEREALSGIREQADRILDTTRFTAHDLRNFLKNAYGGGDAPGPNVNVVSFGFKYGLPAEADLVFDVRFLPNPYFVAELRSLDGRTRDVQQFLEETDDFPEFLERLKGFLEYLVPRYAAEGKTYLSVALGCTGGKHRSVALAEKIGAHLVDRGLNASVTHRDLGLE
jgi:UPF0042 nucleotide-binding protein